MRNDSDPPARQNTSWWCPEGSEAERVPLAAGIAHVMGTAQGSEAASMDGRCLDPLGLLPPARKQAKAQRRIVEPEKTDRGAPAQLALAAGFASAGRAPRGSIMELQHLC